MKKRLNENDLVKKLVDFLKDEKKELNERLDNSLSHFDFEKCIEMRGAFTELRRICKILDIAFDYSTDFEKEVAVDERWK